MSQEGSRKFVKSPPVGGKKFVKRQVQQRGGWPVKSSWPTERGKEGSWPTAGRFEALPEDYTQEYTDKELVELKVQSIKRAFGLVAPRICEDDELLRVIARLGPRELVKLNELIRDLVMFLAYRSEAPRIALGYWLKGDGTVKVSGKRPVHAGGNKGPKRRLVKNKEVSNGKKRFEKEN
jgi:hypothetical protein